MRSRAWFSWLVVLVWLSVPACICERALRSDGTEDATICNPWTTEQPYQQSAQLQSRSQVSGCLWVIREGQKNAPPSAALAQLQQNGRLWGWTGSNFSSEQKILLDVPAEGKQAQIFRFCGLRASSSEGLDIDRCQSLGVRSLSSLLRGRDAPCTFVLELKPTNAKGPTSFFPIDALAAGINTSTADTCRLYTYNPIEEKSTEPQTEPDAEERSSRPDASTPERVTQPETPSDTQQPEQTQEQKPEPKPDAGAGPFGFPVVSVKQTCSCQDPPLPYSTPLYNISLPAPSQRIAWSADNQYLVTSRGTPQVTVMLPKKDPKERYKSKHSIYRESGKRENVIDIRFHPDSRRLALLDSNYIEVWDIPQYMQIHGAQPSLTKLLTARIFQASIPKSQSAPIFKALAWRPDPDGKHPSQVLTCTTGRNGQGPGKAYLWDTAQSNAATPLLEVNTTDCNSVGFDRTGNFMILGTVHKFPQERNPKGTLQVLELKNNKIVRQLFLDTGTLPSNDRIYSMAVSPSNRWLVAGTLVGRVVFWDTRDLTKVVIRPGNNGSPSIHIKHAVRQIVFHPDRELFASLDRRDNQRAPKPNLQLWHLAKSPTQGFVTLNQEAVGKRCAGLQFDANCSGLMVSCFFRPNLKLLKGCSP